MWGFRNIDRNLKIKESINVNKHIFNINNKNILNREFKLVKGIEYALKPNDEIIIGHIFFRVKAD